jgi:hypothetical protein
MSHGDRGAINSAEFHDSEHDDDQHGNGDEKLEECRAAASSRSQ